MGTESMRGSERAQEWKGRKCRGAAVLGRGPSHPRVEPARQKRAQTEITPNISWSPIKTNSSQLLLDTRTHFPPCVTCCDGVQSRNARAALFSSFSGGGRCSVEADGWISLQPNQIFKQSRLTKTLGCPCPSLKYERPRFPKASSFIS